MEPNGISFCERLGCDKPLIHRKTVIRKVFISSRPNKLYYFCSQECADSGGQIKTYDKEEGK